MSFFNHLLKVSNSVVTNELSSLRMKINCMLLLIVNLRDHDRIDSTLGFSKGTNQSFETIN